MTVRQRYRRGLLATAAMSSVALFASACGADEQSGSGERSSTPRAATIAEPIAVTYDGGVAIIDGTKPSVAAQIEMSGFNRLNAAGDDRHILVSTARGFETLDAGTGTMTDVVYPAEKAGHVVDHAGKTVLFDDGTGRVSIIATDRLGGSGQPEVSEYTTENPHHGVAIETTDGRLVVTEGTEESRSGIRVLDRDRKQVAASDDCPGVHGEAAAQGEAISVGCENGVLIYRDGTITKAQSPDPYGRIGNQSGTEASPILLGDYKTDEDAELERPTRVSLIDSRSGSLTLVDLGTSYTFRSLARGPGGEALVLGTDGKLHVIDPESARVTRSVDVIAPWEEPLEWQDPRPALRTRGDTAYVTDPSTKSVRTIDLSTLRVTNTLTLPGAPNEIAAA